MIGGRVGDLEHVDRQNRLQRHVGIGVFRGRAVVVGERLVAVLEQRLARADRLHAHARDGVLHLRPHQRGVQRAEPFERPQRVEAPQQVRAAHQILERRHDRLVLLEDEQPLRGVAPPPVRMRQVRDELGRRLAEHARLRAVRLDGRRRGLSGDRDGGGAGRRAGERRRAVEAQAPDAAAVNDLVQLVLLNLQTQVRSGAGPLAFLDDAAVHVRDVDRPVGRGPHVDRPEERVAAQDELRSRVGVAQLRQPLGLHDLGAADQPADRLGEQQVSDEILRDAMAADDVRSSGCGRVVHRADRAPHAEHAALHVRQAGDRKHVVEVRLVLVGDSEGAVMDGHLEVDRSAFASGAHEPHLPVVVLHEPPLAVVRSGRLPDDPGRRPPEAERVVGAVNPVVEPPHEPALLVLQVAVAADPDAAVEHFALVRDAVAVGIGQLDHVVRRGFVGEDAVVVERQDRAREHQLVGEDGVLVVGAVAVGVFPPADAAFRLALARALDVGHVGDELGDVHAPVAVELDHRGCVDIGIGQHQLHAVARRQHERLRLFLGGLRGDRRLGRKVGAARRTRSRQARLPEHREARGGDQAREENPEPWRLTSLMAVGH